MIRILICKCLNTTCIEKSKELDVLSAKNDLCLFLRSCYFHFDCDGWGVFALENIIFGDPFVVSSIARLQNKLIACKIGAAGD